MDLSTVKLRAIQEQALDFINNSDKKYIILDAPCGCGKSLIAMMLDGTKYLITTKKSLQDQYYNDYSHYMAVLKGKATYESEEEYKIYKEVAQTASITCLNTHSAYYQFKYSPGWEIRDWLVIDEAHNLQSTLQDIAGTTLYVDAIGGEYDGEDYGPGELCYLPQYDEDGEITEYERVPLVDMTPDYEHVVRDSEIEYMYSAGKRIVEYTDSDNAYIYKREYVPISVEHDFKKFCYKGERVLIMSGTILDKVAYCRQLGLDPSEVDFMSMSSPFPKDNRRILYIPCGAVTYRNTDYIWDDLIGRVVEIANLFENDRGIIHTVSYSLADRLYNALKSYPEIHRRLTLKTSPSIDILLQEHSKKDGSIIIACGLEEGLDLKDDLARFQIILKMPYPALGDPVIQKMMELDDGWYQYQTLKQLVQAMGRVVRTETDHGDTFILDSNFDRLIDYLPQYIKDAIYRMNT